MKNTENLGIDYSLKTHLEQFASSGLISILSAAQPIPVQNVPSLEVSSAVREDALHTGSAEKKAKLAALSVEIQANEKCMKLYAGWTNFVFGVGNVDSPLVFVGEAPGADEDLQGEPFVGRAGQLLTKMIEAMGLKREEIYITNVVKIRPPNNKTPEPAEMAVYLPYLKKQLEILQPKVVVCLGSVATKGVLETEIPISKLRGTFQDLENTKVMPTFHPAFLLRNPPMKKFVWEDLQTVMKFLGLRRSQAPSGGNS